VAGSLPEHFHFRRRQHAGLLVPNFQRSASSKTPAALNWFETLSWQKGFPSLLSSVAISTPPRPAGLVGDSVHRSARGRILTDLPDGTFSAPLLPRFFPGGLLNRSKPTRTLFNLPVLNLGASIFSGTGVGVVLPSRRIRFTIRTSTTTSGACTSRMVWKIRSNFTFNYGLGLERADPASIIPISPKPALLSPILGAGSNNLGATVEQLERIPAGPSVSPGARGRARNGSSAAGAGIYWDSNAGILQASRSFRDRTSRQRA